MCRKFKFIQDIDNKTVEDFTAYCMRLRRIYVIFSAVQAFTLWDGYSSMPQDLFIIATVGLFLYVICAGMYFAMTDPPKLQIVLGALIAVSCLWLQEVFSSVYQVVVYPSYYIFISLIGITLQCCSIFILYRFWLLLRKGGDANRATATVVADDVENPTFAPMNRY